MEYKTILDHCKFLCTYLTQLLIQLDFMGKSSHLMKSYLLV